jgi:hypothetical protein
MIDVEAVRAAANYLRNHRGELPRPTDKALQTVLDAYDHHQSLLAHYESELRRVSNHGQDVDVVAAGGRR